MRVERGRGTILYKTLLHMATPHHNGSLFTYIYYTTSNFAKMWHTIHEVLKYLEDPVEDPSGRHPGGRHPGRRHPGGRP